jgi:hypothetical protein
MQAALEPLLNFVDKQLKIRYSSESLYGLPAPQSGSDPTKDIYREAQAEMRVRRDTEFKIAALHLQVCAFVFGASVLAILNPQTSTSFSIIVGIGASLLIVVLWLQVHKRIAYDNASYVYYGNIRDSIESQWLSTSLRKHLSGEQAGPPQGLGYRNTQAIVAVCTVVVVAILLSLLASKFLPAIVEILEQHNP